eukprot:UN30818
MIAKIPLKDGRTRARTTLTLDFFLCGDGCRNVLLEKGKNETKNQNTIQTIWKKVDS